MIKKNVNSKWRQTCIGALLGVIAVGGTTASAETPAGGSSSRLARLEKENEALRSRLESLEKAVKAKGAPVYDASKAGPKADFVKAISDTTLTGFVQASYFHDTSHPDGDSPGYLWNRNSDSFSLNKLKITLASAPVVRSGDEFSAAYRLSLMFGEDAPILNTGSKINGFDNVREAFVELNVPIGTGLNVRAGQLISLLNYESGDGGAANDNFSQGFQWFFTGNGPAAGVQLGYNLTDKVDVKLRLQNGLYAGPVDNNNSKTFIGSINYKPTSAAWISLLGFVGREDSFTQHVAGGSLLAGYSVTPKFHVGTELDYFNFRNQGNDSSVYSGGAWLSYQVTETFKPALRLEYLSDSEGVDMSGGALGFSNPVGVGQDLSSVALTLNYTPIPSIKIQPEVRFDYSDLDNAFGKSNHRFVVGLGMSYLF
jgi:hypothetical protein